MDIPEDVNSALDKIYKKTDPISIFLYGSRARGDFKKDSDYEIGILYKKDHYIQRRDLKKLHSLDTVRLFPFVYEDFVNYSLDTPFPKAVYFRELISTAKTLKGNSVIEKMELPEVSLSDLLEDAIFSTARAFCSVLSSRQNDWVTTLDEFSKSVLFGARALIILRTKKLPLTYSEIAQEALKFDLIAEHKEIIKAALVARVGTKVEINDLYTSISFLNQVVVKTIKSELKKGDRAILAGRKLLD